MYSPKPFKIKDRDEIISFIANNGLAMIISSSSSYPIASHIPLIVKNDKLVGHFAKANPHVDFLKSNAEVLLIFSGAESYISAYAKDPKDLSILPTWDYQIVQVKGKLTFISEEELIITLDTLMKHHEYQEPRALELKEYPESVFRKKIKAIIGFEIIIEDWIGCFRLNQNRSPQERENIKLHLKDNQELVKAIDKYNV